MSRLREIREAKGMKLKQVADLIHTTEVSVSRYEREEQRLTLPLLRKFAEALDASISEIVGEDAVVLTPDERRLLDAYRRAGARERKAIHATAETLAPEPQTADPFTGAA